MSKKPARRRLESTLRINPFPVGKSKVKGGNSYSLIPNLQYSYNGPNSSRPRGIHDVRYEGSATRKTDWALLSRWLKERGYRLNSQKEIVKSSGRNLTRKEAMAIWTHEQNRYVGESLTDRKKKNATRRTSRRRTTKRKSLRF